MDESKETERATRKSKDQSHQETKPYKDRVLGKIRVNDQKLK